MAEVGLGDGYPRAKKEAGFTHVVAQPTIPAHELTQFLKW